MRSQRGASRKYRSNEVNEMKSRAAGAGVAATGVVGLQPASQIVEKGYSQPDHGLTSLSVKSKDLPSYLEQVVDSSMFGRPRLGVRQLWKLFRAAYSGKNLKIDRA